jgi:hypothetical protein
MYYFSCAVPRFCAKDAATMVHFAPTKPGGGGGAGAHGQGSAAGPGSAPGPGSAAGDAASAVANFWSKTSSWRATIGRCVQLLIEGLQTFPDYGHVGVVLRRCQLLDERVG